MIDYYDKMFKNLPSDPRSSPYQEKVTGLIINYPTLMLHLVETSMDVIKILLRDINEMCKSSNGMISDAKILNIAHNISFFNKHFNTLKKLLNYYALTFFCT